ncbi:HNH endonuclease [Streptomyces sp. PTM05]|uniref:HNH endonuclease n=1 Tax=Streptantibioticus parmotrematis TaxID=2873249 RepID=A0ABS7QVI6_9ACTN|nr:HNH endonuclease [Streptantibioticus parmotrematis]MBY8887226.1 HNH endonuclease [Streptantibioticus parmotrematis]
MEQLSILGPPQPVRVSSALWEVWTQDSSVIERFESKRYRRRDNQCWPWLGAVSSTGHGSFRATSLPGHGRRGTVPAHLYAFQLANGPIAKFGWSRTDDLEVCHKCDSHGCTNPAHLRLGSSSENRTEWASRRGDPNGPLADIRGPAGRTRAIAEAVRYGLKHHESRELIDARIRTAELAGLPWTLW